VFQRFPFADEAQRARSIQAVAEVLADRSITLAYLGGAPFAGLGTPHSDIDLFVVLTEDTPPPGPVQVVVGADRIDVETVSYAFLVDAADRCAQFRATSEDIHQLEYAQYPVLDKLIRFALGEIVADDGRLAKLSQRLFESSPEIIRLLVARHCLTVQNRVEDAEGFLALDEWPAGAIMARNALLAAADAVLARRGDVYIGGKWVARRWNRTLDGHLGALSPEAVLDLVSQPRDAADVRDRLWLVQDLALMAITERDWEPVPAQTVVRDPFAAAVPLVDAVLVYRSRRKAVRLSRQGALLWAMGHGRPADDAIDVTRSLLSSSGAEVGRDDVAAYYRSLCASGLLRPADVGTRS
jgi:hypothetical protein